MSETRKWEDALQLLGYCRTGDYCETVLTAPNEERLIELGRIVMKSHMQQGLETDDGSDRYESFVALDSDGEAMCLFTPEHPDGCITDECRNHIYGIVIQDMPKI